MLLSDNCSRVGQLGAPAIWLGSQVQEVFELAGEADGRRQHAEPGLACADCHRRWEELRPQWQSYLAQILRCCLLLLPESCGEPWGLSSVLRSYHGRLAQGSQTGAAGLHHRAKVGLDAPDERVAQQCRSQVDQFGLRCFHFWYFQGALAGWIDCLSLSSRSLEGV